MFILPRRLSAIFVCVALCGAVDTVDARRHLDAGFASATLKDYTESVPAAIVLGRTSATIFAAVRTQRLDNVHPAIAASPIVVTCGERAMRRACDSIGQAVSTSTRSRDDRGPPRHLLS